MSMAKNAIKKALRWLGYELRRVQNGPTNIEALFDNFANLSIAYEQRLNEEKPLIPQNELRPKLLARLLGTPPSEAYFIVAGLAACKDVAGDVCEFGVAQGETSALIANEISSWPGRKLHLFDSFEGLPTPSEKDKLKDDIFSLGTIEAYAGTMSCPEDMVRGRLSAISFPISRYVIHKGFIEALIGRNENLPTQVSFAYVDFDFYEPIKIALDFLDRVSAHGTIIIVDDYDFFSTGAKTAVDEFVATKQNSGRTYECVVPNKRYGWFAILRRKS
jgi:O-methyltransferase